MITTLYSSKEYFVLCVIDCMDSWKELSKMAIYHISLQKKIFSSLCLHYANTSLKHVPPFPLNFRYYSMPFVS